MDEIENHKKSISQVVYYIEQNNLRGVQRFVPGHVNVDEKSVQSKRPLVDIALFYAQKTGDYAIYNYFIDLRKQKSLETVAKWNKCYENAKRFGEALKNNDEETFLDLVRQPQNIFCESPRQNSELLKRFESMASGNLAEMFKVVYIPTWKLRARQLFDFQ